MLQYVAYVWKNINPLALAVNLSITLENGILNFDLPVCILTA